MIKNKLIDCVTFFDNNFMFNLRYNILKEYVDYFVICESNYDHKNNRKRLNFNARDYDSKKIKYITLDKPFPNSIDIWKNQAIQREYILENLVFAQPNDYIFFSDPDEIPNPKMFKNFNLVEKYGVFYQKCYNYKFNLYNPHETPWEGTRVCKKKNLKSIDFMRQKIKSKNLNYNLLRLDKEKSIQIFQNAGWHFNNIMEPTEISLKLKTFAHTEFSGREYSDIDIIKSKIDKKIDLFDRGHQYKKIDLDQTFPKYLHDNYQFYKKFIL
tara:strand:+ start:2944 stop:3750 length:807 start_codon:yes stop_codon:yes gene_type:complete